MKIIVFYVKIYNNEKKKAKIYRIFFLNLQYGRKLRTKKNSIDKIKQLKSFCDSQNMRNIMCMYSVKF